MEKYNYNDAIREDIKNYIKENGIKASDYENIDEAYDALYDNMFISDNVTGNASGSYTFSGWGAEENLCHNMELLGEALQEFGCTPDYIKKGAEACDVTIRCYLLGGALMDVLSEMFE